MASSKKGKKTSKVKDLKSKKVSPSKASQVKGGFNPQPDPPGRSTNVADKVVLNPAKWY